jgi:hypothetical protein
MVELENSNLRATLDFNLLLERKYFYRINTLSSSVDI